MKVNEESSMEIVSIEQIPVVREKIKHFGIEVKNRIKDLDIDNIIATESNLKTITDTITVLNKEFGIYDGQRKTVVTLASEPITSMNDAFKEHITIEYQDGLLKLKNKKAIIVAELLRIKEDDISEYFNELVLSEGIDFISWQKYKNTNDLNIIRSKADKKYKEDILSFVEKVKSDIELIDAEEYQVEIATEYKSSLNCSKAILAVKTRKENERTEAVKQQKIEWLRRVSELKQLGFVLNEAQTDYVFAGCDIILTWSEICNVDRKVFADVLTGVGLKINKFNAMQADNGANKEIKEDIDPIVQEPIIEAKKEPLQAPTKEVIEETIYVEFSIIDTRINVKKVLEFMKSNNVKYKNID